MGVDLVDGAGDGGSRDGSGGRAVGVDRVDGTGDGAEATDWCTLVAAMSTVSGASEPEATVAAALRRRRRRLAVELLEGVMEQISENS